MHANISGSPPCTPPTDRVSRTGRGRRRRLAAVAAGLAVSLVAGACSDSSDATSPSEPEATFSRAEGSLLAFEEPVATVADLTAPAGEGQSWTVAGSVFDPGTATSVAATWESADGVRWERSDVSPQDSDVSEAFAALATGDAGRIAVGWVGDGAASDAAVWRDQDGEWQLVDAGDAMSGEHEQWAFDVAVGEAGTLVAGGESAWGEVRARLWFSPDGESWQTVDGGPGGVFDGTGQESVRDVAAAGGGFVAVGSRTADNEQDGVVWYSPDGVAWQEVDAPSMRGGGRQSVLTVVDTGEGLVAGGYTAGADGKGMPVTWRSPDGQEWGAPSAPLPIHGDSRSSAADLTVRSVALDEEGLLAVGGSDWRPHLWRSRDAGATWELLANPTGANLFQDGVALDSAAAAGGVTLALGLEPTIMRLDGTRWVDATGDSFPDGGEQPFATSVTATGETRLVAGGRYTAPRADTRERYVGQMWLQGGDGWAPVEPDQLQAGQVMDVTSFAGGFVAVGFEDFGLADKRTLGDQSPDGLVWTSPDGRQWARIAATSPVTPEELLPAFAEGEADSEELARAIAEAEAAQPRESVEPVGGPGTRSLEAVAPLGEGFIAVGVSCCQDPGEPIVVVSPNGTDVAGEDAGLTGAGTQRFRDVCVGPDSTAVAVGISGTDGNFDGAIRRRTPEGRWGDATVEDGSFGGPGSQEVYGCAASDAGFIAVGSDDASGNTDARVWVSEDGASWSRPTSGLLGGSGDQWASAVAAVPGGGWLVGGTDTSSGDGDIALWRVDGERIERRDQGEPALAGPGEQSVTGLLVDEAGITVVGDDYGRVGLWHSDTLDR